MFDNFMVLSTDYENYAIIYQCLSKSVMYNRDIITILVRDPDMSKLQSGTEEKIRQEFDRLFGNSNETVIPDNNQTESNATEGEDFQVFKNETEPSTEEPVGKGLLQGRYKIGRTPGLPLEFESHLKMEDHQECLLDYYPDLSLTREQRISFRRQSRQEERENARLNNVPPSKWERNLE